MFRTVIPMNLEMNLIKSIHIATERGRPEQMLPLTRGADDPSANQITVLCGRNRSGKSHLLEQLDVSIHDHNRIFEHGKPTERRTPVSRNICCELLQPDKPSAAVYYFRDPGFMIQQATVIRYSRDFATFSRPERNISHAMLHLLASHCETSQSGLDRQKWDADPSYRTEVMQPYSAVGNIFRLKSAAPFLKAFEKLTSSRLYFRIVKAQGNRQHAELILRYSPRHHYQYCAWSHGQRVLFCYLCAIEFLRIEVLLLDELETHLHPEFMSFLFEQIKAKIPQTVVATHHPHLIFSRLADAIWYLEVPTDDYDIPEAEPFAGNPAARNTPLGTKLVSAETDMEKLAISYKLFDQWDSNLLRLSQSTIQHVTEAFASSLRLTGVNRVLAESGGQRRDLQTDVLAEKLECIANKAAPETFRVLDFGAGRGRLIQEVFKKPSRFWAAAEWCLWEPNCALRQELRGSLAAEEFSGVEVPDRRPRSNGRFHAIIVANVVHECTPPQFAAILDALWTNLAAGGSVFFVELFPLLEVERLAVPYHYNDLHDVLRGSGWNTEHEALNIRNARVSAYWLRAEKREGPRPQRSKVKRAVEDLWRRILQRHCGNYVARQIGHSGTQVTDLVSDWATIASIESYFTRQWLDGP